MTDYWSPVVWVGLLAAAVIVLCLGLAAKDNACVAAGGTVRVVTERQAKGDMNHTICIPERSLNPKSTLYSTEK